MDIRIGTRGSDLALTQTNAVREALEQLPEAPTITLRTLQTIGDRRQGTGDASITDKKKWVIDLEYALLDGEIDLAVHSGKDLPSDIEPGTGMLPVLVRQSAHDAFVGRLLDGGQRRCAFDELSPSAKIGTASIRRATQLKNISPDFEVVEHRGNVPTRIQKLDEDPSLDGIVLAQAGLDRLNLSSEISTVFTTEQLMPALNQGTLVVQFREDAEDLQRLIELITPVSTIAAWQAERALIAPLEADCYSAVCAFATVSHEQVQLSGRVLGPDGSECIEVRGESPMSDAIALGESLAQKLIADGAKDLIAACRK